MFSLFSCTKLKWYLLRCTVHTWLIVPISCRLLSSWPLLFQAGNNIRVWLVVSSHLDIGLRPTNWTDHSRVNRRFILQAVHIVKIDIGGPINTYRWDNCSFLCKPYCALQLKHIRLTVWPIYCQIYNVITGGYYRVPIVGNVRCKMINAYPILSIHGI